MIFIYQIGDTLIHCYDVYHKDFGVKVEGRQATDEEMNEIGFWVNEIPEPQVTKDKSFILKADFIKKQLYYEYIDIQPTIEDTQKDLIDKLILDNINMQMQIDTLISNSLGGM